MTLEEGDQGADWQVHSYRPVVVVACLPGMVHTEQQQRRILPQHSASFHHPPGGHQRQAG